MLMDIQHSPLFLPLSRCDMEMHWWIERMGANSHMAETIHEAVPIMGQFDPLHGEARWMGIHLAIQDHLWWKLGLQTHKYINIP
jgi:hypothetical protein